MSYVMFLNFTFTEANVVRIGFTRLVKIYSFTFWSSNANLNPTLILSGNRITGISQTTNRPNIFSLTGQIVMSSKQITLNDKVPNLSGLGYHIFVPEKPILVVKDLFVQCNSDTVREYNANIEYE